MQMRAVFKNPDGNYLSAGDASVPLIYLLMSIVFLTAGLHWARVLHANVAHVRPCAR